MSCFLSLWHTWCRHLSLHSTYLFPLPLLPLPLLPLPLLDPFKQTELVCSKTSLNFVDSIFEIFGALGCGIPILIVPTIIRSDPEQLVQLLSRARVTRLIVRNFSLLWTI